MSVNWFNSTPPQWEASYCRAVSFKIKLGHFEECSVGGWGGGQGAGQRSRLNTVAGWTHMWVQGGRLADRGSLPGTDDEEMI